MSDLSASAPTDGCAGLQRAASRDGEAAPAAERLVRGQSGTPIIREIRLQGVDLSLRPAVSIHYRCVLACAEALARRLAAKLANESSAAGSRYAPVRTALRLVRRRQAES